MIIPKEGGGQLQCFPSYCCFDVPAEESNTTTQLSSIGLFIMSWEEKKAKILCNALNVKTLCVSNLQFEAWGGELKYGYDSFSRAVKSLTEELQSPLEGIDIKISHLDPDDDSYMEIYTLAAVLREHNMTGLSLLPELSLSGGIVRGLEECQSQGNAGAISLANALNKGRVLSKLDLSFNKIKNKGAFQFAQVINEHDPLVVLNLAFNLIEGEGKERLAAALTNSTRLSEIRV